MFETTCKTSCAVTSRPRFLTRGHYLVKNRFFLLLHWNFKKDVSSVKFEGVGWNEGQICHIPYRSTARMALTQRSAPCIRVIVKKNKLLPFVAYYGYCYSLDDATLFSKVDSNKLLFNDFDLCQIWWRCIVLYTVLFVKLQTVKQSGSAFGLPWQGLQICGSSTSYEQNVRPLILKVAFSEIDYHYFGIFLFCCCVYFFKIISVQGSLVCVLLLYLDFYPG